MIGCSDGRRSHLRLWSGSGQQTDPPDAAGVGAGGAERLPRPELSPQLAALGLVAARHGSGDLAPRRGSLLFQGTLHGRHHDDPPRGHVPLFPGLRRQLVRQPPAHEGRSPATRAGEHPEEPRGIRSRRAPPTQRRILRDRRQGRAGPPRLRRVLEVHRYRREPRPQEPRGPTALRGPVFRLRPSAGRLPDPRGVPGVLLGGPAALPVLPLPQLHAGPGPAHHRLREEVPADAGPQRGHQERPGDRPSAGQLPPRQLHRDRAVDPGLPARPDPGGLPAQVPSPLGDQRTGRSAQAAGRRDHRLSGG